MKSIPFLLLVALVPLFLLSAKHPHAFTGPDWGACQKNVTELRWCVMYLFDLNGDNNITWPEVEQGLTQLRPLSLNVLGLTDGYQVGMNFTQPNATHAAEMYFQVCDRNADGVVSWTSELNNNTDSCLPIVFENMCLHCIYNGYKTELMKREARALKRWKRDQKNKLQSKFY